MSIYLDAHCRCLCRRGSAYAVLGGLRAVAVSDAYSGVLLLTLGVVVVVLSLATVDFDLSGIPAERLTMIGDSSTPIPLAHAIDRYGLHPNILLGHQPDDYPASDGVQPLKRVKKACSRRSD